MWVGWFHTWIFFWLNSSLLDLWAQHLCGTNCCYNFGKEWKVCVQACALLVKLYQSKTQPKLNQSLTNVRVKSIGLVYKPSVRFWSLELLTSIFMLDNGSLLACLGEN